MQNAVMAIYGNIQSQWMKMEIMISVPLVRNLGEAFQRDMARGTSDYIHESPIPGAVADAIFPTVEALSKGLLSRCLHGTSQNQNKAINVLIWQRATKETHASTPTVELATFLAVGYFRNGAQTLLSVLENLGITPGCHCRKACRKLDRDRIGHSCRKKWRTLKEKEKTAKEPQEGLY